MKIIMEFSKGKTKLKNASVAIGVFDGLHLGHQRVIKKMIHRSKLIKSPSIVMTFFPHPIHVLRPDIEVPFLISLPYRLRLIESLGADICVVLRFTKKLSQLTPDQFVKKCLVDSLQPKEIFVGEKFRFGQACKGNLTFLRKAGKGYGFKVNGIPAVKSGRDPISSTRIRKFILDGELHKASQLLGRPVSLLGKVIKGDARGKKLGFPTANIKVFSELIPPCGVYSVIVILNKKRFLGIANIGRRPSFKKTNNRVNIEIHILAFDRNIYGHEIVVEFFKKIRDEKKFTSKKELIQQIQKDAEKVRILLNKRNILPSRIHF